MAVRTKIEPLETFVEIVVREDLAPEAAAKAVAVYARGRIAEVAAANRTALGKESPYRTFVDGRAGAPLETVNPRGGRIVAEFDVANDMLRVIHAMLVENSPVRSGRYRDSHRLFADGVEVDPEGVVPAADEYLFINYQPYARKLEIGRTQSGRAFVIQVEPRIVERTAKQARARFGNIAQIGFSYRGAVGGVVATGKAGNKSALRYPAIVIRMR